MLSLLEHMFDGETPSLVMFDLDGTLVDSVPDLAFAVQAMLTDMGAAPASEQQVRQWVGNGAQKLVERALANAKLSCEDSNVEAALVLFKQHYASHCAVDTCLYEGVLECLEFLQAKQVAMAVVTNKPCEFVPAILESLNITGFFSQIIGGDDLPERKPSPMPLRHCIEHFSCPLSQALMVGDSRNDIQAARAAGIPVVAVNYGYNHGKPIELEAPDHVLGSLAELITQAR